MRLQGELHSCQTGHGSRCWQSSVVVVSYGVFLHCLKVLDLNLACCQEIREEPSCNHNGRAHSRDVDFLSLLALCLSLVVLPASWPNLHVRALFFSKCTWSSAFLNFVAKFGTLLQAFCNIITLEFEERSQFWWRWWVSSASCPKTGTLEF
jgi:hypothetical protein